MSGPFPTFADRLDCALKAATIGRSRLAAEIGVDKSLISRWLSGAVRPSAHNLERLTRLVAAERPGFSMLDWEAEDAIFAQRLGIGAIPVAAPSVPIAAAPGEWFPLSSQQSRNETLRDGGRYPGVYLQINLRFANNGLPLASVIPIWRHGDQLRVRFDGPFWGHTGRILILGHQLFMMAEDSKLSEGMWFQVMNGVPDGTALAMDGVVLSVPHDRSHAPGSTICQMLRIADLADPDQEPDAAWLTALHQRAWDLSTVADVLTLSGPEILAHIGNPLGVTRSDGVADHHLRAPASRGFTCTTAAPTPAIAAAAARWRTALGLS